MAAIQHHTLAPFSPLLEDFCHFIDHCIQQTTDPQTVAELWETQVEAVRINREDINIETIDLLLNTMLNTLNHLAEVQEQKRWKNRVKSSVMGSVSGRKPRSAQHRHTMNRVASPTKPDKSGCPRQPASAGFVELAT